MTDVVATAREVLESHGIRRCSVCVAFSGGLDSMVLLEVLRGLADSLELSLSAVHVNHGLQAQAVQWAQFCQQHCERVGVPLTIEEVTVARGSGLGVEAAARAQRYAVLRRVQADYVALAHHLDDQAETFVLQLLRGAGAKGLSAMPLERALGATSPRLLRPLLGLTRAQLTEFADARALTWVEDDSNADLSFDRNFLRQVVLPVIEQRFPAYRSTLARASRNLAEAAELAALLGEQDLAAAVGNGGLVLDKLRSWPVSRRYNAVRCLLQAAGCAPPARELLTEALRQAFEARDDAAMRVDFGEFSLRRYRGELFAVRNVPVPYGWQQPWRGECELQLPTGLGRLRFCRCSGHGLSARRLQNRQVDIAFRDGGERMALSANRPHRELKKLYQDAGIAPWLRERTPLMFVGKQLALVPGLGVAAEFQAAPDEDAWEVQWVQG